MQGIEAAIPLSLAIYAFLKATDYLEDQDFWTLRLRLSTIEHWVVIPSILMIWIVLAQAFVFDFPPSFYNSRFSIGLIFTAGILVSFFKYILPAHHSRRFLRLRCKAWGGPSRTGIRAELVPYIGDRQDWKTLEALAQAQGKAVMHPIERFSRMSFTSSRSLIISDPTDLLQAREAADQKDSSLWIPQSNTRQGVFQPFVPGEPVSLLWGQHVGFQRRCSRGIISVPRNLLSQQPRLANGVDARGLCLASGILARNKGLNPTSFICNLQTKGMIGAFEENSVFWPRPAKTLRSLFHRECKHYFSGLGDVFVTVATELALLLTDAPLEVAEDWLDARLEHQDIELNNEAYTLGARVEELGLLYRGHYAAMLVSLSAHRVGVRIRPEMLVYDAVCKSVRANAGAWASSADMEERRQRELEALGPRVMNLVAAIV
ncbi:hypothetical protein NLJ89_g6741 [Agrocybe chaxingu]|uniref:Uncharacterized protein n=1 Tax=Agrocybe chaxingu TaxID=84603 RepID=A0A9W8JYK0_9AGAR|nr:hypothetical protein NLJ89_g6741 [Agrocybe chaxingu]